MAAVKKHYSLSPRHQKFLDLAGKIDPVTEKEYSAQTAASAAGFSRSYANVNLHEPRNKWLKELWKKQAEKVRESRRKGIERGEERAAEKRAFDVMEQARFWASFDYRKTGGRIQGQVNATRLVAEMEGRITQKMQVADLRGKSDEELEFIRVNKYIPTPEQLAEFVASRGSSTGTGEAQAGKGESTASAG